MTAANANHRLVCFDVGRVMLRICDNWPHACRVAGVPEPRAEMMRAAESGLGEAVEQCETGKIDQIRFATIAAELVGLSVEQVLASSNAYLLRPYDGIVELVDELNAAGILSACLTNTNENHWRIMFDRSHPAYLPLDRLTYRFASHLIGLRKPEAEIYQYVERETGLTGGRITFFDDVEENVAAARVRGWNAHRVETGRDPVEQMRGVLATMGILR